MAPLNLGEGLTGMNADHWLPKIFWIAIGIYVAIHAYQLGLGQFHSPGPGFIFFLAALFLIILGGIDLGGTLIQRMEKGKEEGSIWLGVRWKKILLVLVILFAYNYFLSYLGFSLSTFLLMLFLLKVVEPTQWWVAILGSTATTLITYQVFKIWLEVPFPKGFIGF